MLKQQHQFFVSLLCLVDAIVVAAACYAAWAIRLEVYDGSWPASWEMWLTQPLALFGVPVTLYAMWWFGMYRPRRDRSAWTEQGQVMKASIAALAALIIVLWAVGGNAAAMLARRTDAGTIPGPEMGGDRLQLAILAGMLPIMIGAHRWLFRAVLREIRRRGRNLRHVAVIGVGRLGQIACRTLERNSWTGINVAFFISHHEQTKRTHCLYRPVRGGLDDLEQTLDGHKVDAIYLAMPMSQAGLVPGVLRRLERFSVDVRIIPDVHPRYLPQSMSVSELEGMPILSYRESPLHGLGGASKRVVDILGSLVSLVVFALPMMATAAAVRMSGPGPLIFKQRRVSLGGEEFNIYKFRTMHQVEDESAAKWTERDDPRVTPVGRFLRRTSLDELPQLLNVLMGDMSLVGPRPERPELIERFREDWRGYMLRQHVKAGMTGWAQVNGLRGDTSLRKRIQYDLFYVRNWSLGFDIKILWMTVFRGFVNPNAH